MPFSMSGTATDTVGSDLQCPSLLDFGWLGAARMWAPNIMSSGWIAKAFPLLEQASNLICYDPRIYCMVVGYFYFRPQDFT